LLKETKGAFDRVQTERDLEKILVQTESINLDVIFWPMLIVNDN